MELNVKVESPSPIQRKLTVRVPALKVTQSIENGFKAAQKTAKLKGFRPGMVPLSVVKQYYGEEVRHQVFHDLINDSYQQALRAEKIRAVGSPQIETPDHKTGEGAHDHTLHEGRDLTFVAMVEVVPEVEVKGYSGIALTRPKTGVEEKDMEDAIKNLLDSQAELVPVAPARAVKKGDYVDMKFDGGIVTETGIDQRPGMSGSRVLEVGSDALIPGFEEQLIGLDSGATKTFRIPFPGDYYEKSLAGKEAEFTVTINELKEKKLPSLDEDFAKTAGYESLEKLREQVKEQLTQGKQQESDRKLRSDLLQALIEKNTFDVPVSLVQTQTRSLAQDVGQNLKRQGFTDQMIQETLAAELQNLMKRAENQVRASLVLEAVARQEKIEVTDADVETEIKKMATEMKVDEARVRDFYAQGEGRREDLEFRIREERAVAFLLSKSKIKDEK